ncbi:MAG: hypothetical protein HRU33_13050 [Rhodobacteraceae bacterium]|nr:hypothetical protein [Paracoccaceae bacterium]
MASDEDLLEPDDLPPLTEWQEIVLKRLEMDILSGVTWQPSLDSDTTPTPPKFTAEARFEEVLLEVACWFLTADFKFIKVNAPETRLGMADVSKVAKPMMVAHYAGTEFAPTVKQHAGKILRICSEGEPLDPRMAFGIWSGKTYSAPGNSSPRLYRNFLWDKNSWSQPAYRQHQEAGDYGAVLPFLEFAIPDKGQRSILLDWVAWSLQNEASKPTWAILLFSEEKGTGKSTIGVVLEALFGTSNTAKIDGVGKLVATHNDRVLDKKLIIAEEVHISSKSKTGNALKDLITSDRTTVNPKYQATKTIPLKACYLFTTNHKPLWLEGGERRYYNIEMDHDGHAQGPRSEEFSEVVGGVYTQIKNPKRLSALYSALMSRELSPDFNPKSMRFEANATPIMRELQAQSGNEADETLEAILAEYCVSVIPSSDFKELVRYLNARNDNAVRNALVRLGWESMRLRWAKKQQRVWARKGLMVENNRIMSLDLAASYDGAVEKGFVWFPLEYFVKATWRSLKDTRLKPRFMSDAEFDLNCDLGDDGGNGPFLDSTTHRRYQTWKNDIEMLAGQPKFLKHVES